MLPATAIIALGATTRWSAIPLLTLRHRRAEGRRSCAPLARGEALGRLRLTEPEAGQRRRAPCARTRVRDGDDCVLNGEKVMVTNGGPAGLLLVIATTDPARGREGPHRVPGARRRARASRAGQRERDAGPPRLRRARVALRERARSAPSTAWARRARASRSRCAALNGGRIGIAAQARGHRRRDARPGRRATRARAGSSARRSAQFRRCQRDCSPTWRSSATWRGCSPTRRRRRATGASRLRARSPPRAKLDRLARPRCSAPTARSRCTAATATSSRPGSSATTATPRVTELYEGTERDAEAGRRPSRRHGGGRAWTSGSRPNTSRCAT